MDSYHRLNEEVMPLLKQLGIEATERMQTRGLTKKKIAERVAPILEVRSVSAYQYVNWVLTKNILITPKQTQGEVRKWYRKVAVILEALGFEENHPVIREACNKSNGFFVYPPNNSITAFKIETAAAEQALLEKKFKGLRLEHRESLERLTNTYLARYAEEQRADYQGAD